MRIRDPGWKTYGSGMEKSRIRDREKYAGSATLGGGEGLVEVNFYSHTFGSSQSTSGRALFST
jgi:hypothetical protein